MKTESGERIMKIKTSELTGPALDWAVAVCEGFTDYDQDTETMMPPRKGYGRVNFDEYSFSTDWDKGGPIIERENMHLSCRLHKSYAMLHRGYLVHEYGDTPLIAAMRGYVASKLGDEVEIPEELT